MEMPDLVKWSMSEACKSVKAYTVLTTPME